MSESLPISPARFAEAIKDLSLTSVHLKVLEIRNDIAHLDYSNEQLLPYARGTEPVLGAARQQPDQDCIDAIRENEAVIARKLEQLRLLRAEVEHRGASWSEFQSKEEADQQAAEARHRADRTASVLAAAQAAAAAASGDDDHAAITNGVNGAGTTANGTTANATAGNDPWSDGTFQIGTIRNGQLHMEPPGTRPQPRTDGSGSTPAGGSLSDEQLRRALEERLRTTDDGHDEEEEGMHL